MIILLEYNNTHTLVILYSMHSIIRTERSQPYSFRVMLHGIYVTIKPNPNWSELFAHAREAPTTNKTQDDDSYTVPRRISSRAPRLRPTLARVYILSLWLFFWCVRCGLVRFAGRYQLPVPTHPTRPSHLSGHLSTETRPPPCSVYRTIRTVRTSASLRLHLKANPICPSVSICCRPNCTA